MKISSGLEAIALHCERGYRTLFENLDFHLQAGEILHVKGSNGSGKTSLLRIVAGLAQPVSGEVFYQGLHWQKNRSEYSAKMSWAGHKPGIKAELTALENLQTHASLLSHHVPESTLWSLLQDLGLYGFEAVFCQQLSAGQKRRVALAQVMMSKVSLWILDEPFTSLDTDGIEFLETRIREHLRKEGMVLLTGHQDLAVEPGSLQVLNL